jgi:hypothetical protein
LLEDLACIVNLRWLETKHHAPPDSSLHHGQPSWIDSMGSCRGVRRGRGRSFLDGDGRGEGAKGRGMNEANWSGQRPS